MTFKELQKVVQPQSTTREQTQLFERLGNKRSGCGILQIKKITANNLENA
jgi:hypothetical protein